MPYRFESALLGGARLPRIEANPPVVAAPERPLAHATSPIAPTVPGAPPASAALGASLRDDLDRADAARTAPHRDAADPALGSLAAVDDLAGLRRRVGRRDPAPPIAWAWSASTALGAARGEAPGSGAALLSTHREALGAPGDLRTARPGDLVVFDRAVAAAPASLVAVVGTVDDRGVVEFLYLGGGVVRRGFLDATRPRLRRDDDGRVVNTFLRHNRDWPPKGTRFLAGELVAHHVRLASR